MERRETPVLKLSEEISRADALRQVKFSFPDFGREWSIIMTRDDYDHHCACKVQGYFQRCAATGQSRTRACSMKTSHIEQESHLRFRRNWVDAIELLWFVAPYLLCWQIWVDEGGFSGTCQLFPISPEQKLVPFPNLNIKRKGAKGGLYCLPCHIMPNLHFF